MSLEQLKSALPDYAKDVKLNLGSLLEDESLSPQQRYGTFLATALASGNGLVLAAADELARTHLSEDARTAAKAAAGIMAQNNIYYRFTHLAANKAYAAMPAKLRMNVIGRPGIEKADFELFSLAVSAINGCGMCIDAHEKILRDAGVKEDAIQAAVRLAAVTFATAQVLNGEAVLAA